MPLMSVGVHFQLEQIAGESYLRCIGAGLPSGITSAYRDPKRQQWLYDQWRAGVPGFNFALPPDKSMHCKGLALDLPVPAREWMRDHGKPYGWYGVPNEAWHFNYVAAFDQHAHDNTEDDMNAEQEAKLDEALAGIAWLKKNMGGSNDAPSVIEEIRTVKTRMGGVGGNPSLSDDVRWLKARIGGSTDGPNLTELLRDSGTTNPAAPVKITGTFTATTDK